MRGYVIEISPSPSTPASLSRRMMPNSEAVTAPAVVVPERTASFRGARTA